MSIRLSRGPIVLVACALWAGCSKGEPKGDTTVAPADTTKAPPAAAATPPALTDANIAALLDAANAADSAAGHIASTKATNAEVKAFAKTMMRDHHMLRKQGEDLVKKLNVTPELPAGDNSQAAAKAWDDSLTAMPKGAAWDKAYIDHEVAYHQALLQTAQTAQGAAQNQELKDLIGKAIPAVQAHLTKAQSISSSLVAPPTPKP